MAEEVASKGGVRERLVPVKTGLILMVTALSYVVGMIELIEGGYGAEPFVYLGLGVLLTILSVRRVRAVRA